MIYASPLIPTTSSHSLSFPVASMFSASTWLSSSFSLMEYSSCDLPSRFPISSVVIVRVGVSLVEELLLRVNSPSPVHSRFGFAKVMHHLKIVRHYHRNSSRREPF